MAAAPSRFQYLLTLPPGMAPQFPALEQRHQPLWFATSDPEGPRLGSGGGTANLLIEAWQATAPATAFPDWLNASQKLILHAGGESRRLPAYAPTGKLLMPIPVFRWGRGQRLDQTLLDVQLPAYERLLRHARRSARVMLTSGDVLLRFPTRLPAFPDVDVLGLGMWVAPETAQQFGVFFLPRGTPEQLAFFLQKPKASRIRELAADYLCLVDTGVWLLSERAIEVLLQNCGWDAHEQRFVEGRPSGYDFYGQFAPALGREPAVRDRLIQNLTCAVIPLPDAQFFHFGTSRQIIESVAELQNLVLDETKAGHQGARQRPDQVTQNAQFPVALRREGNDVFWIENSAIAESWNIASEHVVTGVPANSWQLQLDAGCCLDVVPVGPSQFCLRPYHIDDRFSGALGSAETLWFAKPALQWFRDRNLDCQQSGLRLEQDIQAASLFPVLTPEQLTQDFVQWLFRPQASPPGAHAQLWAAVPRLSAQELLVKANLLRLYEQRARFRNACLPLMLANFRRSVFFRLDLEATARVYAATPEPVPQLQFRENEHLLRMHGAMFRAAVARCRGQPWQAHEEEAFSALRALIRTEAQLTPALPVSTVQEDQIVWARSPVRLDLAGGWTDTPPYCLQNGGKVLNLAVDLNGQPPVQVFARVSEKPELVLRSIDLGSEERVTSYAELESFGKPQAPFALAKAAVALAGFLPAFHKHGGFPSLADQLRAFGGGIELSLVCAVPKGSGLGTSSILSATILAALSDLCGLGWDRNVLFSRTLALEQMLTTGGGWQDQAGALFHGIKVVETTAGLRQRPSVRWLPPHLFDANQANRTILLYYTGLTRLAKSILAEIVRGVFLNSPARLATLEEIAANTEAAAGAIQSCDYALLQEAVNRSWLLNQQLDSGTNPPAVRQILDRVEPCLGAAKLLGAGGGGYLLMLAKDEDAGRRIRHILSADPPNPNARFVDFSLSNSGLQVTRS